VVPRSQIAELIAPVERSKPSAAGRKPCGATSPVPGGSHMTAAAPVRAATCGRRSRGVPVSVFDLERLLTSTPRGVPRQPPLGRRRQRLV